MSGAQKQNLWSAQGLHAAIRVLEQSAVTSETWWLKFLLFFPHSPLHSCTEFSVYRTMVLSIVRDKILLHMEHLRSTCLHCKPREWRHRNDVFLTDYEEDCHSHSGYDKSLLRMGGAPSAQMHKHLLTLQRGTPLWRTCIFQTHFFILPRLNVNDLHIKPITAQN